MSDAELLEKAQAVIAREPGALIAVVGPTASGKTELAIRLAETMDGEIISADSVQIYRGFDQGSGKPTASERARAEHHLIDMLDPNDEIDARSYADQASALISDIRARGRRPIVCGGTFLWVKALVFGLADAPSADETKRTAHREFAEREGRAALHARLKLVDEKAAARLHPNDLVRVSRALEVFELTGRPMSAFHDDHGFRGARYPATFLAIAKSPDVLTERIEQRVRTWLAQGWVDETRALVASGYGGARAMGSVGYKEVASYIAGDLPESELEGTIVRATRVYARRQRTFLNHVAVSWV